MSIAAREMVTFCLTRSGANLLKRFNSNLSPYRSGVYQAARRSKLFTSIPIQTGIPAPAGPAIGPPSRNEDRTFSPIDGYMSVVDGKGLRG